MQGPILTWDRFWTARSKLWEQWLPSSRSSNPDHKEKEQQDDKEKNNIVGHVAASGTSSSLWRQYSYANLCAYLYGPAACCYTDNGRNAHGAPIVWGGDHPPVQMDLIETITGGSKPFGQVRGVALDKDGNLYAVDGASSQVLKFDPTGKLLMQWGSKGTADGQFVMSGLQGTDTTGFVAVDSQGNVYVTENNRVQKFDSNGKFLTKWGKAGSGDGQFGLALAMAIDAQDNVYVVDINNNDIEKFDSSGKFLLKWGGKGSGDGQFSRPTAVAIDMQGNVLVSDVDDWPAPEIRQQRQVPEHGLPRSG